MHTHRVSCKTSARDNTWGTGSCWQMQLAHPKHPAPGRRWGNGLAPSTLHPAAFTALPSQARAGSSSEPPLMQWCISAAGWCITEGSRLEQKVIYGISNNLRTRRVKQATSTLFCVKNFSVSHTNPTFTENSFCF